MPTTTIVISMLIVVAIVMGSIVALPLIVTRLTGPRWAIVKSIILFFLVALGLGIFLPAFISVPGAFAIAYIGHRARVARYAERASNELPQATGAEAGATMGEEPSGNA